MQSCAGTGSSGREPEVRTGLEPRSCSMNIVNPLEEPTRSDEQRRRQREEMEIETRIAETE